MSFLDKLLDGAEVEWRPLGEVCDLKNGYTPSKSKTEYWEDGTIPWFRMEDIRQNGRILDKSIQYISTSAVKGNLIRANSLFLSTTATIGEHALVKVPFLTNQQITSFTIKDILIDKIDVKYLFHLFFDFGKWCKGNANKNGGLGIIGISKLKQYLIPIPCPNNPEKSLEIQRKIVAILDDFSMLTAELTARKKQYDHYRDQLLSFGDEVEWKTLGEVAKYSSDRVSSLYINKSNYIGVECLLQNRAGKVESSYVPTEGNCTQYRSGDVLIGNIRPYLKKIWLSDCDGGTNGDVLVIRLIGERLNSKFLYQLLADNKFFTYNMQHAKGAKMPRGNKGKIMEYRIPIPPLSEQQRIVDILDKFDTLTNSISEGLPKEIELRKKQYEYYRDMLFDFPKP